DYVQERLIDSIDVKLRKMQYLFDYQILDNQHVLLAINPTYLGDYHDSAVCIINREKNVIKTFSFLGTPVPLYNKNSPFEYRNTAWWYAIHTNFPVKLNKSDSTVIVTLAPFEKLSC